MNLSTGNYQTHEEYRSVNKTTDLSSSIRVTTNDTTEEETFWLKKNKKISFFSLFESKMSPVFFVVSLW
jgi:hypothetical protein